MPLWGPILGTHQVRYVREHVVAYALTCTFGQVTRKTWNLRIGSPRRNRKRVLWQSSWRKVRGAQGLGQAALGHCFPPAAFSACLSPTPSQRSPRPLSSATQHLEKAPKWIACALSSPRTHQFAQEPCPTETWPFSIFMSWLSPSPAFLSQHFSRKGGIRERKTQWFQGAHDCPP